MLVSGTTDAKSFICHYDIKGAGKTRRVTLGRVSEYERTGRTIEDARDEAATLVLQMRGGVDPKAKPEPEPGTITLRGRLPEGSSLHRWLADWLDLELKEITRAMVEKKRQAIKDEVAKRNGNHTENRSSEPGAATANGVMRALGKIWNDALDEVRDLPANPVRKLKMFPVPSRERRIKGDDLPAFYQAVMAYPSRTMRDYILLLLFTGLRRDEAAGLKWSDLDFSERIIILPRHRTKARRPLDLPMCKFVRKLLKDRRAIGVENEYVFPGDSKSGHLQEPKKAFMEIGKACGILVSPHDLRRTFITVARRCPGIAPADLQALVNHASERSTTGGYDQISTADLIQPAEIVGKRMLMLCQPRRVRTCWLATDVTKGQNQ